MRPMESDGDHFLTYYLTKDDEAAEQFKESRADPRGINALQEEEEVRTSSPSVLTLSDLQCVRYKQATEFHFVRDYEVVKVEQEVPNEFLLVFDDGDPSSFPLSSSPSPSSHSRSPGAASATQGETRHAGAYYKLIERKMLLKKKRTEVRVPPPPKKKKKLLRCDKFCSWSGNGLSF